MEGFHYLPLSQPSQQAEIRLLSLKPRDDTVTISLYSASLKDKPHYEALSYTWGDTKEREEIRCNDQWATIPKNLYNALRNLQQVDRARTLWVDGICINQWDNLEKSGQIRIMSHIFESAQIVLVWIGTEDTQIKRTFSEVRRSAAAYRALGTDPNRPMVSSIESYFSGIAKDLSAMLLRDWFKRIWVIQEVSVCRNVTVVCGSLTIDWDELSAVVLAVAMPGKVIDG